MPLHYLPRSTLRETFASRLRASTTFVVRLFGVVLVAAAGNVIAAEPSWPSKPLRLVVAAGAGSSVDVFARVVGNRLSQSLGQPVIVEPRPGGNGSIAGQAVAVAKPDGYTMLFAGNSALVINALMAKNLPYDGEKAFVAVAPVVYVPLVIAVSSSSQIFSMKDLLAQAKSEEVFFATPGSASLSRLIGENLNERAGTRFVNVAYPNSGPAQTDVMGGRVPVLIDGLGGISAQAKSGRLRLLAVSTVTRAKDFPEVPTIAESIPNFVVPGINSIVAPAGTPSDVVELLNRKVNEILRDPAIVEQFATMGGEAAPGSRAELDRVLKEQRVTFKRLIERANIHE